MDSTKVKIYKNEYGYKRIKCPFCEDESYVRDEKQPFRNLQRHLINAAKNEALEKYLNIDIATPHLDYIKQHVKIQKPKFITSKYGFDDDLIKE